MSAPRRDAPVRRSVLVAALCLAALCRCSTLDLDGLDNGQGRDASATEPHDGASSDRIASPSDARPSPDPSGEAMIGPSDVDGADGSAQSVVLDSTDLDSGSFPDGAPGDVPVDAYREVTTDGTVTPLPEAGAPDAGRLCDPSKPFGPPVLIASLQSTAQDGSFRLLPDELTGFFWSSRAGGPGTQNLYVTTRPDTSSPFGAPALLNNVNASAATQFDPSTTADGLDLAFRSQRAGGVGLSDIYWATRTDVKSDFANVTLLGKVNSTSSDVQPFLAGVPNGTTIYFASNRTGDYDLYRATGSPGSYNPPRPITELNSAGVRDEQPIASDDDLTIYFSSARPGGLGANDVWMATRATRFATFGAPTNVTQVNTTALDYPDWISPDACRLYLSSDVSGNTHVYVATRPM